MTGIYKITNIKNGKIYVGQAYDIKTRIDNHKNGYKNSDKTLYKLLREDTDSIDDLSFEIIQECSIEELNSLEQHYIDLYNSYNQGYNNTTGSTWHIPPNQKTITFQEKANLLHFDKDIIMPSQKLSNTAFKVYIWLYNKSITEDSIIYSSLLLHETFNVCERTLRRVWNELLEKKFITIDINKKNNYLFHINNI